MLRRPEHGHRVRFAYCRACADLCACDGGTVVVLISDAGTYTRRGSFIGIVERCF